MTVVSLHPQPDGKYTIVYSLQNRTMFITGCALTGGNVIENLDDQKIYFEAQFEVKLGGSNQPVRGD